MKNLLLIAVTILAVGCGSNKNAEVDKNEEADLVLYKGLRQLNSEIIRLDGVVYDLESKIDDLKRKVSNNERSLSDKVDESDTHLKSQLLEIELNDLRRKVSRNERSVSDNETSLSDKVDVLNANQHTHLKFQIIE